MKRRLGLKRAKEFLFSPTTIRTNRFFVATFSVIFFTCLQRVLFVPRISHVCLAPLSQSAQIEPSRLTSTFSPIPRKIWHSGPDGISPYAQEWVQTCLDRNPSYRHEVLTDASGDAYVMEKFADRPDIVSTYLSLTVPILKADLLRYLILYADGGMWSDLDVSCNETKIDEWIPTEYRADTKMVVGLEYGLEVELEENPHFLDDGDLHTQFTNWIFMAAPGVRHLAIIIDAIIVDLNKLADSKGLPMSKLTFHMIDNVVDMTGPKRMTRTLVASLEKQLGQKIDDTNISRLKKPKLIGDVLILPTNAWANEFENEGPKYVKHHYAGTWKHQ